MIVYNSSKQPKAEETVTKYIESLKSTRLRKLYTLAWLNDFLTVEIHHHDFKQESGTNLLTYTDGIFISPRIDISVYRKPEVSTRDFEVYNWRFNEDGSIRVKSNDNDTVDLLRFAFNGELTDGVLKFIKLLKDNLPDSIKFLVNGNTISVQYNVSREEIIKAKISKGEEELKQLKESLETK